MSSPVDSPATFVNELVGKKVIFRNLYINDSDKRKWFSLFIKIHGSDDECLGVFKSQQVKVISKPSKKKLTNKNRDRKFKIIFYKSLSASFNRQGNFLIK
jgi:hypothetical protein